VRRRTLLFLLTAGLGAFVGRAVPQLPQVAVPQVAVPQVPLPGVGPVLPEAGRALGGTLRELSSARALRAQRLFNEHRAELDRDPRGDLVVRAEVVAIDITPAALDKALAADFRVVRADELADLGVKITVLQTPEGMTASRGLKKLRKLDPDGSYDYNHIYLDSGDSGSTRPRLAIDEPAGGGASPATGRVGLIDGGVDSAHQSLAKIRLQRFGCDGQAVPSAHGTAVASILVSRQNVAELFAADVYCGQPAGGAVDAVAAAFGWMSREKVAVINVSLVGPRNSLLERVIQALVARGHVIVAAVGNDGPAAAPLYPAAYDGVIGVTGVDAKHRVLIEACRGKHVDFAALGEEVPAAAAAPDQYAAVRGTSFAAPRVAALFTELRNPDVAQREQLLGKLLAKARDLGKPGRDEVYGDGELDSPSPL
jgi:subtilisin family serine protease